MNEFSNSLSIAQKKAAAAELSRCNELSSRFGLTLSDEQIEELVSARAGALGDTGRMEFGGGALPKLIEAFCDSAYITQESYADTLLELQDSFYYFKNESEDSISDDELIEYMRDMFEGVCAGSLEYMSQLTLDELCRGARGGDYKELF